MALYFLYGNEKKETASVFALSLGVKTQIMEAYWIVGGAKELFFLGAAPIEQHLELSLDDHSIDSYSGLTMSVNRPENQPTTVDDALFRVDTDGDGWDGELGPRIFSAHYDATKENPWRCFYIATENATGAGWRRAFLEADNYFNHTKPNLGIISYNGNTNNNLFMESVCNDGAVRHYPDNPESYRYLMVIRDKGAETTDITEPSERIEDGNTGIQLWASANETVGWYHLKSVITRQEWADYNEKEYANVQIECKDIIKRPDGRFVIYATVGHKDQERQISAWMSDTVDPSGDWTYQGVVVSPGTPADENQKYWIKSFEVGCGLYLHHVCTYDNVTGFMEFIELYLSRDGLSLALCDSEWLSMGYDSEHWHYGMITSEAMGENVGLNTWDVFYGLRNGHHDSPNRTTMFLAHGTLGFRRIGQYSGTGIIITDVLDAADALYVNCNATNGSIKAELLDPSDYSVIVGYTQSDSRVISSDTYGKQIRWAGNGMPNQNVRIKFYITNAILYSFWTGVYSWRS